MSPFRDFIFAAYITIKGLFELVSCPRCGGEMQEGEAFTPITVSGSTQIPGFAMSTMPGMNFPGNNTTEERIQWREKTGRKTGRFFKSDEEKTIKIIGQRCKVCGYIEFYARE